MATFNLRNDLKVATKPLYAGVGVTDLAVERVRGYVAEAQKRLETSVGQGGAAFVQNAILGPLADKRFATINRIETAIGRNAAKPDLNAEGLKTCTVQK